MIRRTGFLTVLVLALALLPGGSAAADARDHLDREISLKLEEADLRTLFDMFKEILEVELEVAPSVGGTITFAFDEISVRTTLNAICESANCTWELLDGNPALLRILPDPLAPAGDDDKRDPPAEPRYVLDSPISLKLVDADATAVLDVAAKIIHARLLLDRDLQGKTITVDADGMPLSTFLDGTCEELGCSWKLIDGKPSTLAVHCPEG